MSKDGAPPPPIGFSAAPPPSAPPSYSQAIGGVPPQAPFHPHQQPVVTGAPTTIVTTVVPLGPQSTHMVCPHCHHEVDTATASSPSNTAWISCLVMCLLGCNLGCCLIPFCMDDCMTTEHKCPNCKAFLGNHTKQ